MMSSSLGIRTRPLLALECARCRRTFNIAFRKHFCRSCQRAFCSGCTPHRIEMPNLGKPGLRRACEECHRRISFDQRLSLFQPKPAAPTPTGREVEKPLAGALKGKSMSPPPRLPASAIAPSIVQKKSSSSGELKVSSASMPGVEGGLSLGKKIERAESEKALTKEQREAMFQERRQLKRSKHVRRMSQLEQPEQPQLPAEFLKFDSITRRTADKVVAYLEMQSQANMAEEILRVVEKYEGIQNEIMEEIELKQYGP
eukprot:TRINITY_DN2735_c0_g1_i1.p1 TRINITY_DN2735_c0_g1~~TRINITY_DN2735_c0_g1_i1.p1  ORF type:complete len:257 (-),score=54.20 TRINITY_DN2735_c0_g1_i1:349-1119(-)